MLRRLRPRTVPALGDDSELGPDEVHLWVHHHFEWTTSRWMSHLSVEERERARRLTDPVRVAQFSAGRAMCRDVLSRYAETSPEEWRFLLGDRGQPRAVSPHPDRAPGFSLSHDGNVTVCAVSAGALIGVDIEGVDHFEGAGDVAREFFSLSEVSQLSRLPTRRRAEYMASLWTLKESLAKACGRSLAEALSGSRFAISQRGKVTVAFDGPEWGDPRDWRFALAEVEPFRIVAVAVGRRGDSGLRLHQRTWPNPPARGNLASLTYRDFE